MDRTARECMQALPARGTNADAFLIMPVQRIPRWVRRPLQRSESLQYNSATARQRRATL